MDQALGISDSLRSRLGEGINFSVNRQRRAPGGINSRSDVVGPSRERGEHR
jgi:hypothetical protein